MRTFTFPFEPGGPERIVIQTTGGYRGTTILVDGVPVGYLKTRGEFKRGVQLPVKGGGVLAVKLAYGFFGIHLLVHYEGMPLHVLARGSPMRLRAASAVLFFFGGLWLFSGFMALAATFGGPAAPPEGTLAWVMRWVPLMGGAGLIVLAAFIRQGSIAATIVAIVFFSLYLLLMLGGAFLSGVVPIFLIGGIIPLLVLLSLVYALRGIRELNRERAIWHSLQAPTKVALPLAKDPQPAKPEPTESA